MPRRYGRLSTLSTAQFAAGDCLDPIVTHQQHGHASGPLQLERIYLRRHTLGRDAPLGRVSILNDGSEYTKEIRSVVFFLFPSTLSPEWKIGSFFNLVK